MENEAYIEFLKSAHFKGAHGLHIIIAGGGTGGHIFPAIAIAKALKKQNPSIEILFVGAEGKMEMEKVPEAGFRIVGLYIAGYNRSSLLKNIMLPFKLAKSFYQVRKILKAFKPDAVIGVGGYSSFPMLRLAQTKNIPTYIHESNSYGGKSNRLLAKRANKIFVASYGMEKFFPAGKLLMRGNPVRNIFSDAGISKKSALAFYGLEENLKTVLVIGGSLGARSINEVIRENIQFFRNNNLQLIWQTGKEYAEIAASVEEEQKNIWTGAFINNMANAYAASDFVISRSGAMSVSELCVAGKPVIFVPYPFAAEDHQTANANSLVNNKAALIVNDAEVKSKLMDTLLMLVNDNVLASELRENIVKYGNTNADEIIASEILKDINGC